MAPTASPVPTSSGFYVPGDEFNLATQKAAIILLAGLLGLLGVSLFLVSARWAVKTLMNSHRHRSGSANRSPPPQTPHPGNETARVHDQCRDAGPARQVHLDRLPTYEETNTPPTMPPPSYGSWTLYWQQTHPAASTDGYRVPRAHLVPCVRYPGHRHHAQSERDGTAVDTGSSAAGEAGHPARERRGQRLARWRMELGYLPPSYTPAHIFV